jgi:hypothetical protein
MKKYIYILLAISFFCCSTAQNKVRSKENKQLNQELEGFIKNRIEKYGEHNVYVNREIIQRTTNTPAHTVEYLFDPRQFELIRNFNAKSEKDIIHFDSFFSKQDFASMRIQIKNNKLKYWSELIDKNYFSNKKYDKEKRRKFSLSIPVFVKDFNYAIIYVEYIDGGSLRVFKKSNNKWNYIANGFGWSSD